MTLIFQDSTGAVDTLSLPQVAQVPCKCLLTCLTLSALHSRLHNQPTQDQAIYILDLVLTTESDRIGRIDISAPLPGCDHCPTSCDYVFHQVTANITPESPKPHRRAWNRGHYSRMRNWNLEFAYLNAEDSFNHFASIVSELTELHVPKQQSNNDKPPWKTRSPTSLVNRRQAAWQTYKRDRCSSGRNSA